MDRRLVSFFVIMILLMFLFGLSLKFQTVKAESGTIYIRADGSIDPPTILISTLDNVTYTLTGDITTDTDGVIVERDNIIVDGAGFAISGVGASERARGTFSLEDLVREAAMV